MEQRPPRRLVSLLLTATTVLGAFALAVGFVGSVAAAGPTGVTSCQVIDSAGQYEVTADITTTTGTCIEVTTGDVVLDGQGHSLNGSNGAGTYGVKIVGPVTNVSVTNVDLNDWQLGIHATSLTGGVFENNTLHLTNTYADGIVLEGSSGVRVANNTVRNAGYYSIRLTASSDNTLVNNTVYGSQVRLGDGSNDNTVAGTTAHDMSRGVNVVNSNDNRVENGYFRNVADAITVDGDRNVLSGNDHVQPIRISGGVGNVVENNTATEDLGTSNGDKIGVGVEISQVAGTTTVRNNVIANRHHGIDVRYVDVTVVVRNNTLLANDRGLYLSEVNDTTLRQNTVAGSTGAGLLLIAGQRNLVYDNVFNNSVNVQLGVEGENAWNVTDTAGTNVVGGQSIAGNVWARPDGTGFSQTCADGDADGICDSPYGITGNDTDHLPLAMASAANDPPTADFTYSPSNPTTNGTITFDASGSTDPDGTIASYEWDFDADGQFDDATGVTPALSFSPASDYDVSLRVTDDEGATNETTMTVSVLDADVIASCGVIIDSPGPYRLTGDLTDSAESACIVVASSDVTLDGDGHVIDGVDGADTVGVAVAGASPRLNVTVRNLALTDWDDGVRVGDGSNATLRDLSVEGSTTGVSVVGTSDAVLRDSSVSGVTTGVFVSGASNATVRDATIHDATTGVEVIGGSGATLRNVETDESVVGVELDEAGDVVLDGGYYEAGSHGIHSSGAESVRATGLDVETGGVGLYLTDGPVTVENVTVNALVTATSEADVGIRLSNASGTLQDLDIESSDLGVRAYESDVTVSDATFYDAVTGIELTGGTDATIENVEASQGVTGIELSGAGNVTVDGGDLQVGVHGVISYGAEFVQIANVAVTGSHGVTLYDGAVALDTVSFTGTSAPTTGVSLGNVTGTVDALAVDGASVGVEAYEATVTVRNSLLRVASGGDGVSAISTHLALESVTVERDGADPYGVGINATKHTDLTVDGGTIRNATTGISVEDSTLAVDGTAISDQGGWGVYAENTSVDVRNASIVGGVQHSWGIALSAGSRGSVADTTVRTQNDGIVVSTGAPVTLVGNDVASYMGVQIEGSASATVEDNTVVADSVAVFVWDDSHATIVGNTLTAGNDEAAVEFRNDGTGTVYRNDLRGPVGVLAGPDVPVNRLHDFDVDVVLNDLSNATVALRNDNGTAAANGVRNYYGPRGPAPGRVVGNWSLGLFLTAPPDQVDPNDAFANGTQQFGFDFDMPAGQVYAFGTPAATEDSLEGMFGAFEGAIYRYDENSQSWSLASGDEPLDAMDAVAVVPTTDARAVLDFADATPPRPAERRLSTGWSFVAPRAYDDLGAAFSTATVGITDVSQAMAEPRDQPAGAGEYFGHYTMPGDGSPGPRVSPFTGYFVYVADSGTIPGRVLYGERLWDARVHLNVDAPADDDER